MTRPLTDAERVALVAAFRLYEDTARVRDSLVRLLVEAGVSQSEIARAVAKPRQWVNQIITTAEE